jgi:hypothetical protein
VEVELLCELDADVKLALADVAEAELADALADAL